jgi:hypothetical protein
MHGAKFYVSVLAGFLRAHTPPPLVGEVECHHEFERGKPRELTELRCHLRTRRASDARADRFEHEALPRARTAHPWL